MNEASPPSPSSTVLRSATAADAGALRALDQSGFSEPWSKETWAGLLTAEQDVDRVWVLVSEESGELLAFMLARIVPPEIEILKLATAPRVRRSGLARQLLVRLKQEWARAGGQSVWLEVRASNRPARALYAAVGFQESGSRRSYYTDGEDALILKAVLDSPDSTVTRESEGDSRATRP